MIRPRDAGTLLVPSVILLVPVEVSSPDKLDLVFVTLVAERVEALLVPPDTTFYSRRQQIADLAATTRLPAIYGYREHVEVGGLMSYGPDIVDQYRRAATYVDKILKGGTARRTAGGAADEVRTRHHRHAAKAEPFLLIHGTACPNRGIMSPIISATEAVA
jgi:ABC-type uncharacterized transport system substrate-binding protein